MCGLVGVIGDMFEADKKMFNYMLQLDTSRGPHSTGIARIPNHNRADKIVIVKDTGTPWDLYKKKGNQFFNNEKTWNTISGDYAVLMGHNRWATVGKVTAENAHPFDCDNIIGAQNGTLTTFSQKDLVDHEHFETDSEALFHNFDVKGVDATMPLVDGAWALTWYNIADDTFNLLRNKERPLYFAWKKNGKTMYYASEFFMIYAAAEKFNIELENDTVYELPVDTLYTFKMGNLFTFNKDRLTKREMKGHQWVRPKVTYNEQWKASNTNTSFVTKSASESANVFAQGNKEKDGSNTVVPFLKELQSTVWEKDHPYNSASYWHGQIGKFVEFYLEDGIYVDEQRKTFIKGRTVNGNKTIRIYDSTKNDVKAVLGDKDIITFAAKVKRVKTPGSGMYLLIDTDDISDVMRRTDLRAGMQKKEIDDALPFDNLFKDGVLPMVRGKTVTPEEYEKAVNCGCAWCSAVPSLEESPDLVWLTNDAFLCSDCKTNPDVMQFVQQANM